MALVPRPRFDWQLRTRSLALGERTRVMGIVNVTPDSFSDGGQHAGTDATVIHALRLLDEGADILDIGGESTRPGSAAATDDAISEEEEQRRVLPVIVEVLRARSEAVISIDTYRASTARLAVEAGAEIVNDVSGGLWDASMLATCAELRCGVVVMHTRGLPGEWALQEPLQGEAVVASVLDGLGERVAAAVAAGVARERVMVDPGFGFGKRGGENWALLAGLDRLQVLELPMLVGLSRKGFLDPALPAVERDGATHAADVCAVMGGTHVVRVHDVPGAVRAARVVDAVCDAEFPNL
jgi:dihydropteroate synthase